MKIFNIPFEELLLIWGFLSLFIFLAWVLMMSDPDNTKWQDIVISIICGILALPLTVILLFCLCVVTFIINTINTGNMSSITNLLRAMFMVHDCRDSNQDKIDAAIQKYWDACNYPRKKKKQMRKEALKDYNFYLSLQKTLDFYG